MTFKQFDINFCQFRYVVKDEGILVTKKNLISASERFVPFEDIGSETFILKERKNFCVSASILFFILASTVFIRRISGANIGYGAEVFWLLVSAIFFIIYAIKRKNGLFLFKDDKTEPIKFVGTKIYERRLSQFIKNLLYKRDSYLSNKYPKFEGLKMEETIICINAGIPLKDGLFLKKLTKHPLKKLAFESTYLKSKSP